MSGVRFPFRRYSTRHIQTDLGTSRKARLIATALLTKIGERRGRPDLGLLTVDPLFKSTNNSALSLIKYTVEQYLESIIPAISITQVLVEKVEQQGAYVWVITIQFQDLDTNNTDLVSVEYLKTE